MRHLTMLALAMAILSSGCAQSCPAALLVGVLTEQEGELVVIPEGGGSATRVNWPSGHTVRRDGDTLVVTDLVGMVIAREGDSVRLGGGETTRSGTWDVCGLLEVA